MDESKVLAQQVGARIRSFRHKQGMSLETLALTCEMNAAFLGHVERGMRCPTIYTLQRICNGLNISLSELFETDFSTAPNAAAIQHIAEQLSQVTPEQARKIVDAFDSILSLLDSP